MFNQKSVKVFKKFYHWNLENGIGDFGGLMYSSFLIKKSDVQCSLNIWNHLRHDMMHIFKYHILIASAKSFIFKSKRLI